MANHLENCPGCLSSGIMKDYVATDFLRETWSIFSCANCTLGFLNPVPSWTELAPYYDAEYGAYSPDHAANETEDKVVAIAAAAGELRHTPIRSGMRILDVGCGGGYFLRVARK